MYRRTGTATSLRCTAVALGALLAAMSAVAFPTSTSATESITEYSAPPSPYTIVRGPDGAMWFANQGAKIGRVAMDGTVTQYPTPLTDANITGITSGPDGALWFTEYNKNLIGRITTSGTITREYTVSGNPAGITSGPDGALWFVQRNSDNVGRMTTAGTVTAYYSVPSSNPALREIVSGPDSALWFTEQGENHIGRITTSGSVTEYATSAASWNLTVGPDNALWFTEPALAGVARVGRVSTAGSVTEYVLPAGSDPRGIAQGADGALWIGDSGLNAVTRMTVGGAVTNDYTVLTSNAGVFGIAGGPDGALWFTENSAGEIGHLTAATQLMTATTTAGTLAVNVPASLSLGSLAPGSTASNVALGSLAWTDTLNDSTASSITLAATDLYNATGPKVVPFTNFTVGSGSSINTATNNTDSMPTAGPAGALSGADTTPGTTYSSAVTLASGSVTTEGTWTQPGNTITVVVPANVPSSGTMTATLQYTVVG